MTPQTSREKKQYELEMCMCYKKSNKKNFTSLFVTYLILQFLFKCMLECRGKRNTLN